MRHSLLVSSGETYELLSPLGSCIDGRIEGCSATFRCFLLSSQQNAYTELLERRSQLERRQSSALPRSLSDGYGAIDPRDPVWSGLHRILSSQQRFDELVLRFFNFFFTYCLSPSDSFSLFLNRLS